MTSNYRLPNAILATGLTLVVELVEPHQNVHFLAGIYSSDSGLILSHVCETDFPFSPIYPSQFGLPPITGSVGLSPPWSVDRVQPK